MANTDYLSGGTTVFSNLSLNGTLAQVNALNVASSVSGSRVTSPYIGLLSSAGTINPAAGTLLSFRTIAASALTASAAGTNVRADEIVLIAGGASGMSLAVYSNGTVFIFNSAASAKYA